MKQFRLLIPALFLLAAPMAGFAAGNKPANRGFFGLQMGRSHFANHQGSFDPDTNDVVARVSGTLTPWLSLEGRLGTTVSDDTGTSHPAAGTTRKTTFNYDVLDGVYLRLEWPKQSPVRPYLIGGYSEQRTTRRVTTTTSSGLATSTSRDYKYVNYYDASWGGGVDIPLDRNVALNLEYMRYYNEDDATINRPSIGLNFYF